MLRLPGQLLALSIIITALANISSCTPAKEVIYFNDLKDTTALADTALYFSKNLFETPIQKNDQLWITVGGSNINDLSGINSASGMGTGGLGGGALAGGGANTALGYLVEADGKIQLPFLGRIQAEGITRTELEIRLTNLFKEYTKNPVVNVRFLNYGYTVLGEVTKSGRYPMQTERVTILEAIGVAGDITELGRRDNVIVIREVNGQRKFGVVNLLSKSLFKSPFYYLRTNDVIYVEPVKAKFIARSGFPQYLGLIAVGLSLVLTIINVSQRR